MDSLTDLETRRIFQIANDLNKIGNGKYFDENSNLITLTRKEQIEKLRGRAAALLAVCDSALELEMMEMKVKDKSGWLD